eukprot:TRINITY_DN9513_c0_g1_i1.p1 TRINITY_DN9513_c0_g1~~TRINITY_DN9513_c0_g1_i1.p1  ORF type:complete len:720 (+),score=209.52 TRINITY_DN9513_c0_g1_i1:34-2160(+)
MEDNAEKHITDSSYKDEAVIKDSIASVVTDAVDYDNHDNTLKIPGISGQDRDDFVQQDDEERPISEDILTNVLSDGISSEEPTEDSLSHPIDSQSKEDESNSHNQHPSSNTSNNINNISNNSNNNNINNNNTNNINNINSIGAESTESKAEILAKKEEKNEPKKDEKEEQTPPNAEQGLVEIAKKELPKFSAMVCTKKVFWGITEGDLKTVTEYMCGAVFTGFTCAYKDRKMNLVEVAQDQCESVWEERNQDGAFVPIAWHVRRVIFDMICESMMLGEKLLEQVLTLTNDVVIGGHKAPTTLYTSVLETARDLVINRGANVNLISERGNMFSKSIVLNCPELVELFLQHGALHTKKVRLTINLSHSEEEERSGIVSAPKTLTIEADSCAELAASLYRQNDGRFLVCSDSRSGVIERFHQAGIITANDLLNLAIEVGDVDLFNRCLDANQYGAQLDGRDSKSRHALDILLLSSDNERVIPLEELLARGIPGQGYYQQIAFVPMCYDAYMAKTKAGNAPRYLGAGRRDHQTPTSSIKGGVFVPTAYGGGSALNRSLCAGLITSLFRYVVSDAPQLVTGNPRKKKSSAALEARKLAKRIINFEIVHKARVDSVLAIRKAAKKKIGRFRTTFTRTLGGGLKNQRGQAQDSTARPLTMHLSPQQNVGAISNSHSEGAVTASVNSNGVQKADRSVSATGALVQPGSRETKENVN